MIRAQIPFVRVQSRGTAVPAEEDLTARLAIQQLQHAGAARARERRYVMERPAGTWSVSRRHRITRRVRANPEALKIAKEQMGAHRQRRTVGRRARARKPREKPFQRLAALVRRQNWKQHRANFVRVPRPQLAVVLRPFAARKAQRISRAHVIERGMEDLLRTGRRGRRRRAHSGAKCFRDRGIDISAVVERLTQRSQCCVVRSHVRDRRRVRCFRRAADDVEPLRRAREKRLQVL